MSEDAWNIALKIAATLGPGGSAMLLVILYFVNKERVEKDRMLMQMTVTGIKAMNAATNAINSLRGEVKAIRRRAGRR
jgi:hypothetical protein